MKLSPKSGTLAALMLLGSFQSSLLADAKTAIQQADEAILLGKASRAIDILETELKQEHSRYDKAEIQFWLAKALAENKELKESFALLKKLAKDGTYDFGKIVELQFDIANAQFAATGDSNIFDDYEEAIAFYQTYLESAPYARGAAQSMLRIGNLQYDNDEQEAAVLTFRKVINNYPTSHEAGSARVLIAQYLESNTRGPHGDIDLLYQARAQLRIFKSQYAKHDIMPLVDDMILRLNETEGMRWYLLGEFYLRETHYRPKAAKRYLYRAIVQFPNTDGAIKAEDLLASLEPDYKRSLKQKKKEVTDKKVAEALAARKILPPEATDRARRQPLVLPEQSKGKFLLPPEDLNLEPIENDKAAEKKIQKEAPPKEANKAKKKKIQKESSK